MKQLVIGVLAHVDAGKTTLSEALLYTAGAIPTLGRVDHRDAYLDTHDLERARGHHHLLQAGPVPHPGDRGDPSGHPRPRGLLHGDGAHPPGAGLRHPGDLRHRRGPGPHGDPVAAAAAQPHPHLPLRHQDGPAQPRAGNPFSPACRRGAGRGLPGLHHPGPDLGRGRGPPGGGGCWSATWTRGPSPPRDVSGLIRLGKVTPVFFGSALHLEGEAFLQGLEPSPRPRPTGGLRRPGLLRSPRDHQGNRLTYLKVTGGALSVRPPDLSPPPGRGGGEGHPAPPVLRGQVPDGGHRLPPARCAPPWASPRPYPGQGLGAATPRPPLLEPVVTYRLPCRRRWTQGPPAQAPPAGGGGPPAPPGVGPGPPGDPRPPHGPGADRGPPAPHPGPLRGGRGGWTRAASCTKGDHCRPRGGGWATTSPCGTTPRSTSSWSPCPRGPAWCWPPGAARTCWPATGSGSSSPTWPSAPTGGSSPGPPSRT